MDKHSTERGRSSSPHWETVEEWARVQIQTWLQDLLAAEVTELLGHGKAQRRAVAKPVRIARRRPTLPAQEADRDPTPSGARPSFVNVAASKPVAACLSIRVPSAAGAAP